ncbi:MAG: hypothetical protein WCY91_05235 [Acidithiobacillus sp.]|jgi:hypothetical protein|uniref:Uncharacterized protein n=1 Tax=Acidithiobacillus ferruginosus TaxID=3063951 RepID=A0ACD5IIB5_9PROT|nr:MULTISPECIES: hypothetical protein [Acidithiobacillus]MCL5957323.1 hypothetical protein [Gammaproteobacteria bacterium]MBU2815672.1 hypothetical protein [Acidithiobacillus ferruginosus]MCR1346828.1 hypothetical protein [Acidithiobacillus ferrooxidans]MCR1354172.1 hypothetical protein [Acidithiobacillus ferrooxidans]UBU62590.1 hypothetical protein LDB30_00925 [Acidithiobacillus ferrooxidans]
MSTLEEKTGFLTHSRIEGKSVPDFTGKAKIDGQVYLLSGRKYVGEDGREYIFIRLRDIFGGPVRNSRKSHIQPPALDDDDDY